MVYAANTPATLKNESNVQNWAGVNGVVGADCFIAARDPNANKTLFKDEQSNCTRVFLTDGVLWDNHQEDESGWFFTRAGAGYVALRAAGAKPLVATRSPLKNGYLLESADIWAPVVIQTGQAAKVASFDAFKAAIKAQPFTYTDGKLTCTAINGAIYEYWSNSTKVPVINGQPLDLNPPLTYDYPYLKMKHGEDTVTISHPGYPELVLNISARGQ